MRKIRDDQPRFARAEGVQVFEQLLAIVERSQRIPDQDEVEGPGQCPDECTVFDVSNKERKVGVSLTSLGDHQLAEIDADSERRLERGEQAAGAAAELKDPGAWRDEEFQIEAVLAVEERRLVAPAREIARPLVEYSTDFALAL
jgi:hypothetical protein